MAKTIEENFIDWEHSTFGFGYGSGEQHIVSALKTFLECCNATQPYDYRIIENRLTPVVTWLFINILAKQDIIEYGTSPRFGWLTVSGRALKHFIDLHPVEYLVNLVTNVDQDYAYCFPSACDCDKSKDEENCKNPFWV